MENNEQTIITPVWRRYTLTIEEAAGVLSHWRKQTQNADRRASSREFLYYERQSGFDQTGKIRRIFGSGNGSLTPKKASVIRYLIIFLYRVPDLCYNCCASLALLEERRRYERKKTR